MAFTPVGFLAPQYENYPNYWLKFYQPSTTTPIAMATDATGATTLAKSRVNLDGFLVTDGGSIFIPYLETAYDAYLFPSEDEADANTTVNAIRVANNVLPNSINESDITEDVSINIAAMKLKSLPSDTKASCSRYYADGDLVSGLNYYIKTPSQAANDGDVADGFINHTLANGNIAVLNSSKQINVKQAGAKGDDSTNDSNSFIQCNNSFGTIRVPEGVYRIENIPIQSFKEWILESKQSALKGVSTSSILFTSSSFVDQFKFSGGQVQGCDIGFQQLGQSALSSSKFSNTRYIDLGDAFDLSSAVGVDWVKNTFGVNRQQGDIRRGIYFRKNSTGQTNINNHYSNRYASYSECAIEYADSAIVSRANNHYGDWFEDSTAAAIKIGGNVEGLYFWGGYFETTGSDTEADIEINPITGRASEIYFKGVNFLIGNNNQTERIHSTGNSSFVATDCPVTLEGTQVFAKIESATSNFHTELHKNRLNAEGGGTYEARLFSKSASQIVSWSTGMGSGFVTNDESPLSFEYGVISGNWTTLDPSATPSVRAGNRFRTNGTTEITSLTGGTDGQEIIIKAGNTITVLGIAMILNDVAKFVNDGGTWHPINK